MLHSEVAIEITFASEELVGELHNGGLHDGVDKSVLFGQLGGSQGLLDGDVLLEVVEECLGSGVGGQREVRGRIRDDQSVKSPEIERMH